MKSCSYCGRENDDAACNCKECGTEFSKKQEGVSDSCAIQKTIRIPILARRVVSLFLGILFFLCVAPDLISLGEVIGYLIFFLVPASCVFLFAGRNFIVEIIGWFFLLCEEIMFVSTN
jgi:hypothetical protein